MNFNNIKAIVKKELKSYFDHPLGYILLAVFLGLGNFLFFREAFLRGEASIRPFFEFLPWFLLFLVPATTMKAFAAEQKEGTIEVILTQPISELELLTGKFLGNLLFILIALGLTLFLPLTLSLGGRLDLGIVFAQYLGAVFLSASIVSIGLFSSTVTRNQTVSFITALFISFTLIIMGLEAVVLGLPYPLNNIFAEIGILDHFNNIARGVIDIRDIVYFLSLAFIFLSITYLVFMARKLNRNARKYKTLQTGIVLMIVIAIVVNLFGSFVFFRLDFTEQKLYSLSKGSISVLGNLDDVVTVKLYASKQLPTQVSLIYRDVKDMLQDYKNASKGKIQFIQKFPDSSEKAAEDAQSQGIQPVQFNIVKSDEYKVKDGYLGIAIQYGDNKESIPFIQSTDDLEYKLTSLIRKITSGKQKKIVFTAGHGEKELTKDYQGLNRELSKRYKVETAKKKELSKKLKGADLIIIAGPKQKFSGKEKKVLTEFVNNGKSALLLIDAIDVNVQYLMANANKDSFADFVAQFGVKVNSDLVYDQKFNEQVPLSGGGGASYVVPYPMWPKLNANPNHIITSRLKQVTIPWPSSLSLDKNKLGNEKVEPLLQTSEFANHQTKQFNISPNSKNNPLSQKNLKRFTMGYALQKVGKSNKGRLIVLGDSDFLTDQFSQQSINPIKLALNSIDWLGQDELLIGIRSKNAQPRQLKFSSDATKNFVRYFNMVGIVILVIGYGLWRMNRRRNLSKEGYIKV